MDLGHNLILDSESVRIIGYLLELNIQLRVIRVGEKCIFQSELYCIVFKLGCSPLCVGPAIDWRLVHGVPLPLAEDSWDRHQHPRDPECWINSDKKMDGWKCRQDMYGAKIPHVAMSQPLRNLIWRHISAKLRTTIQKKGRKVSIKKPLV